MVTPVLLRQNRSQITKMLRTYHGVVTRSLFLMNKLAAC